MDGRVTSPTEGPPPPCKQALNYHFNPFGLNIIHVQILQTNLKTF